jgi:hypothetical protein
MPRFDGTGPFGQGPMGRGLGPAAPVVAPALEADMVAGSEGLAVL